MKKVFSMILIYMGIISTAFADIIDPGPYPGDFPRPVPAPTPEPVDDGEVVVIKTLLCVGLFLTMGIIAFVSYKKSNVKE